MIDFSKCDYAFFSTEKIAGVYFLFDHSRENPVYIGKSIDIYKRLCTHHLDRRKLFDYALFIEINDQMERDAKEQELIRFYNPYQNKVFCETTN